MSDISRFKVVTDNWLTIAEESLLLPRDSIDVSGAKTREEAAHAVLNSGKMQWVRGWDGYGNWEAWALFMLGNLFGGAPKTQELLSQIPGIKFAGFLNLKSGTILKTHHHPENAGLLTYHLGLVVPEECYLKTDGKFYSDKNGKAYIFDGTKPHYAFNASGNDRMVLHVEFVA